MATLSECRMRTGSNGDHWKHGLISRLLIPITKEVIRIQTHIPTPEILIHNDNTSISKQMQSSGFEFIDTIWDRQ